MQQSQLLGILCAIGGAVCFSIIDMIFKALSGVYPLYQVVFARSIVALLFLFLVIVPLEGGLSALRSTNLRFHGFRGAALIFANFTFFLGLSAMPLADAVAISFATPLVVTTLSVLFLRERVGPWRWGAVVVGFAGVVIVVQPGSSAFQPAALLPLAAAFGYGSLHVLTRHIGPSERGAALSFYPLMTFLAVSALAGLAFGDGRFSGHDSAALEFLLRGWVWPNMDDAVVLIALGLVGGIGGYLIGQAYRMCEAGLVAPFEYIALPMAMLWGILVFKDWPDTSVWVGSGLIVGAGLVSAWRETRHRRKPARARPRASG